MEKSSHWETAVGCQPNLGAWCIGYIVNRFTEAQFYFQEGIRLQQQRRDAITIETLHHLWLWSGRQIALEFEAEGVPL